MHRLYELKDKLLNELMSYAGKEMSDAKNLAAVDTLAHATKNLCKVIESKENEYSGRGSYGMGNGYGRSYDGYYTGTYEGSYDNNSYARGGNMRSSSNGYSGHGNMDDIIREFRNMAGTLPVNKQDEINRLIMKMEQI